MVAEDGRLPSRSVTVFGQKLSIRPELTASGIALVMEDCPGEDDLTDTGSLRVSAMKLKSMQWKDFP